VLWALILIVILLLLSWVTELAGAQSSAAAPDAAVPSSGPDNGESSRYALLIGINDYLSPGISDLRGAINDVETMREILTRRLGFDTSHVTVLTNEFATRAAIVGALERLVTDAGPDDVIYVHYSGHGSQVKDGNGDEPDDGWDETILPYDARTPGVADITDDELGGILSRLRAGKAVIVLDSCHSGTATRGLIATRSVPADTRTELYDNGGGMTRALVVLDTPERYVLLTGAAAWQRAMDGPIDDRFHGFFSYALARSLDRDASVMSPQELHSSIKQVYQELSERLGGMRLPYPQVEAAPELLEEPLLPPIATAPVSTVSTLPSPPVLSVPATPARVSARWATAEPPWRARIESLVTNQLSEVDFVGDDTFARFVIDVDDDSCRVMDAGGLSVVSAFAIVNDDDTAIRLAGIFSRSWKASALLAMTNPASTLRVDARVMGSAALHIRRAGEPRTEHNSLMLEIRTSADCYLTIVDVDAEGGVNLLFPNTYSSAGFYPNGFVRGDEAVRIPDSLKEPNRAGFFWDFQPPAGIDAIQVFASTDLETAETIREWIRHTPTVATRGLATRSVAAGHGSFEQLRIVLAGVTTRGIGVVASEPVTTDAHDGGAQPHQPAVDWNAVSLRIHIVE
jgi:hypothetical protein